MNISPLSLLRLGSCHVHFPMPHLQPPIPCDCIFNDHAPRHYGPPFSPETRARYLSHKGASAKNTPQDNNESLARENPCHPRACRNSRSHDLQSPRFRRSLFPKNTPTNPWPQVGFIKIAHGRRVQKVSDPTRRTTSGHPAPNDVRFHGKDIQAIYPTARALTSFPPLSSFSRHPRGKLVVGLSHNGTAREYGHCLGSRATCCR